MSDWFHITVKPLYVLVAINMCSLFRQMFKKVPFKHIGYPVSKLYDTNHHQRDYPRWSPFMWVNCWFGQPCWIMQGLLLSHLHRSPPSLPSLWQQRESSVGSPLSSSLLRWCRKNTKNTSKLHAWLLLLKMTIIVQWFNYLFVNFLLPWYDLCFI